MAISLNVCISDPMLVKPKCVLEALGCIHLLNTHKYRPGNLNLHFWFLNCKIMKSTATKTFKYNLIDCKSHKMSYPSRFLVKQQQNVEIKNAHFLPFRSMGAIDFEVKFLNQCYYVFNWWKFNSLVHFVQKSSKIRYETLVFITFAKSLTGQLL